ncbi:MAG TPA: ornithine carbamoyltransferase [Gammaproteobacteria bacterium]|nr:ornithine carbamoyltransferase [Gammaproteobacteria bacterium]
MSVRHFLTLLDLSPEELRAVIQRAQELKALRSQGVRPAIFSNQVLAMIFDKSSTRTRVSFESAMVESGGAAIFLSPRDTQLGRGEAIADTARVLSRMCDAIMVRTFSHDAAETLAKFSEVPVINGLTDSFHPCQLLADMQTYFERRGDIKGRKVAWIGDGNNMCNSYINAAQQFGFALSIATPIGYEPSQFANVSSSVELDYSHRPEQAVINADLVVTDVWASMGQENEAEKRHELFHRFQVSEALLSKARSDVLFMHCLPAHRGEEVDAKVLEHPKSVVWDEAGNRLHAQKALLELLLHGTTG